ncbi:hypothetical protein BHU72_00150 [Desulfuribacillus stibiiarsenatis]|uniref:Flagellar biosynthesis protein FlgN n=1 Tax=Desulfuribacillus stibiiarsenatis TaxID=1390249 RepID=A0A1E5L9L4_9FIRM|nr:flagellar protein FlgN [Desulfuribacillus stibiiarsenatis]OEH86724.1 hypothetical protein BHU72_00150 [Desulfuribacillus stibiiarsenatis]
MKFIEKFYEILRDQLAHHEKLLSLSQEKKTILISGSLADLEKIVKEEHKLIQDVRYMEKDRHAMVLQLAESLKISPDDITISFLTNVVQDEVVKQRLGKIKSDLEEVVQELAKINELNAKLLQQSLDYIQTTIEAITEDPDQDLTYSKPVANSSLKKGKSVFDART